MTRSTSPSSRPASPSRRRRACSPTASPRPPSRALPPAREVVVEVVDVRDVAHDLTNNVLTGFASPDLQVRLDAIAEADAVVVATPVYAASYSGLFKMLIDVLPKDALRDTPVLLGATGGTARHSLAIDHALRPLFAHLGALVAPVAVFAASEDWGSVDGRPARASASSARVRPSPALVSGAAPRAAGSTPSRTSRPSRRC